MTHETFWDHIPACIKVPKTAFILKFFGFWMNDYMDMEGNKETMEHWKYLPNHEKEKFFEEYEEWRPGYFEEIDLNVYNEMAECGKGLEGISFLTLPPECIGVVVVSFPYQDYMKFYPNFYGLNYEGLFDDITMGDLKRELDAKNAYIASLVDHKINDDYFERHYSKIRKNFFPHQLKEIYDGLFVAKSLVLVGERNDFLVKGKKRTMIQNENKKKRKM